MTTQKFVTFVLDQSGSMNSIKDDTIGGFNTYLDELRKDSPDAAFTLILFDSNAVEVRHRAVGVTDVPQLTNDTYKPGASTPLIDACMKAIKATEEKAPAGAHVVIAIQTDGQENCSTEYKNVDLAEAVQQKTKAGWLFIFIGAGIDAFMQAGSMGIPVQHTMNYTRANSRESFQSTYRATRSYLSSDDIQVGTANAAFTSEERMAADPNAGAVPSAPTPGPAAPVVSTPKMPKSMVDDIKI